MEHKLNMPLLIAGIFISAIVSSVLTTLCIETYIFTNLKISMLQLILAYIVMSVIGFGVSMWIIIVTEV